MFNNCIFKKVEINIVRWLVFTFLFSFNFGYSFNKCLWIKADSMKDKESIEGAIFFAYEHDFDTIFLQVRSRGDAFYNSDLVPKNNSIKDNLDPLKYAIDLSHSLGIEIHAWFNTYILWSANSNPYSPKHLYYNSKNWLESNIHGKSDSNIDITQTQSKNWEGIFLSPNHPEVNNYLASICMELILNYDIDGLHFDYIRFQDDIYGYNKIGRDIFENKYNFDPLDIKRDIISTKYGWNQSEIDSMQSIWNNYKIENINNLVYRVRNSIDSLEKKVKLSAAVKPNPDLSKKKWSQDWKTWIDSNIVDFVVPMNYSSDMISFNHNIEIIKDQIEKNKFDKIIMGISIYNQDAVSVSDKVYLSYLYNFKGFSLFSYDNKKDSLYWFKDILDIFEIID